MKIVFKAGCGVFSSIILYSSFIIPVSAAVYFVDSAAEQVRVGEEVEAQISVDTEGERINVFNVAFTIPEELEFKGVSREQSAVNLWVQEPAFDAPSRKLTFIGGVPGGAAGKIRLLSVRLRAAKVGDFKLNVAPDSEAYLSDGLGTAALVRTPGMALNIAEDQFGLKAIVLISGLLTSLGVVILLWLLWRKRKIRNARPN